MKKAFTLIELLIVVAIIAILAAIAVPNFLEAQTRAKVSRVQSDQRTYATALETYYIDNNSYPPHWPFTAGTGYTQPANVTQNHNYYALQAGGQPTDPWNNISTFAKANGASVIGLTTPVSYISTYVPDAFASAKQVTFGYAQGPAGFLLFSPGADGEYQLDGTNNANAAEHILRGGQSLPSPYLIAGPISQNAPPNAPQSGQSYTYDATNGTGSFGDVYRTK